MGRPLQLQSAVQHSDSQTRPAVQHSGHQMPVPALSQCGRHRQPRLPECGRGQQFQAVAKGCQQGSLQRVPVSSTASCSHSGRCQQFYTVAPPSSRQLHASCSHSGSCQQFQTVAQGSLPQAPDRWSQPGQSLVGRREEGDKHQNQTMSTRQTQLWSQLNSCTTAWSGFTVL